MPPRVPPRSRRRADRPSRSRRPRRSSRRRNRRPWRRPKADVELARNAKPVEVKPDPAPKQDVDALSSSIGLDLGVKGPLGVDASASAKVDARLASDRVRDRNIRQWSPDWVQYDEYYRPILINPYHERVRIVYIYDNAPRIVWIPPLARAVLEVAQFAAYSFTALVDTRGQPRQRGGRHRRQRGGRLLLRRRLYTGVRAAATAASTAGVALRQRPRPGALLAREI